MKHTMYQLTLVLTLGLTVPFLGTVSLARPKFDLPQPRKQARVFGLVKVQGQNVYLVENWKSRSMKTYLVKGTLTETVKGYADSLLLVSGKLNAKKWSGDIMPDAVLRSWVAGKTHRASGIVQLKNGHVFIKDMLFPFNRKGLDYEVTGDKKNEVKKLKGNQIEVEGILDQKNNWAQIAIEVESIIKK